jgi:hypothetical protein
MHAPGLLVQVIGAASGECRYALSSPTLWLQLNRGLTRPGKGDLAGHDRAGELNVLGLVLGGSHDHSLDRQLDIDTLE